MGIKIRKIDELSLDERKELLRTFYNKVVLPQRRRMIYYRSITNQSAQIDGYIAQLVASIVTGIPGTERYGKSTNVFGDLSDGTEVKSTYRTEQKDEKEDAHINFGPMTPKSMRAFLAHKRCILVHTSYDVLGRYKVEILDLDLERKGVHFFEKFYRRSKEKRPQFQPRLYPDYVRDRIDDGPSSFKAMGATVLARVVETADGALVDLWSPNAPMPIEKLLTVNKPKSLPSSILLSKRKIGAYSKAQRIALAKDFFKKCILSYRKAALPFCRITKTTQNLGFAKLSQHLVSIVVGVEGNDSNARGADLFGGGEIKQAMGEPDDDLGTEDWPRLNLGKTVAKMLGWPSLYAVRIVCKNGHFRVKVLEADMAQFRKQVEDYFGKTSKYCKSENLQYHVPRSFDADYFTGKDSTGRERKLLFKRLICLEGSGS